MGERGGCGGGTRPLGGNVLRMGLESLRGYQILGTLRYVISSITFSLSLCSILLFSFLFLFILYFDHFMLSFPFNIFLLANFLLSLHNCYCFPFVLSLFSFYFLSRVHFLLIPLLSSDIPHPTCFPTTSSSPSAAAPSSPPSPSHNPSFPPITHSALMPLRPIQYIRRN